MQYRTTTSWRQPQYVAGLLALTLLTAPAFASAFEPRTPGPYFGVGFGQSKMKDASTAFVGTTSDDSDTAIKFFGGYMFNPFVGLELGFNDFGKFTGSFPLEEWRASGFDFSVVGMLPVPNVYCNFALFGKVGANFWNVDDNFPAFGVISTSGTSASYGLGAELGITRNAGFNLQWERFTNVGDPNLTGKSDIDTMTLNFVYHFGTPRYGYPAPPPRRYPY